MTSGVVESPWRASNPGAALPRRNLGVRMWGRVAGGATSRLCATHKNGARVRGHAGAWERGRGVQDTHALCERRRGDTGGSRAIARGHDALGL